MPLEVHAPVSEEDALGAQPPALDLGPETRAEGDAAALADDAVPGDHAVEGRSQGAQGPAHGASATRHAQKVRDLAIGRDSAGRYRAHGRIDRGEEPRGADARSAGGAWSRGSPADSRGTGH
jgi:hypothetical protein